MATDVPKMSDQPTPENEPVIQSIKDIRQSSEPARPHLFDLLKRYIESTTDVRNEEKEIFQMLLSQGDDSMIMKFLHVVMMRRVGSGIHNYIRLVHGKHPEDFN